MSDETKIAVVGAFVYGAITIVGLYMSGTVALRFGLVAASASYFAQVFEAYAQHIGTSRWPVLLLWAIAVLSAGAGVYIAVFGG